MLDEGPRDQPPGASRPQPTDPVEPTPREWATEADVTTDDPVSPSIRHESVAIAPPPPPMPTAQSSTTDLIKADLSDAWARLDESARLLVGGSVAAIVITILGLPLRVWDSAPFALLVLVASTITAVTGWFGASSAFRDLPIPRSTIELIATLAVVILAVLKAIEILFDFDTNGIVGLVVGLALVGAAVVQLMAARQRGADPLGFMRGDQGTRIAAAGLLLVLIGWAFNLSISFWTMGQAALPLAVLTIAALTIAEAPRIESPIPVAWVGAGIAVFGAILALAHWNDLVSFGRTELELDVLDFLGLLAYSVGVALIIAGGVLSGRDVWQRTAASRVASTAGPATPTDGPIDGANDLG
jgi:hypothetical protein